MHKIAPENIDTFIGLYNYARENNIEAIKTYKDREAGAFIMRNGLGVAYGINSNIDFLKQQKSSDFTVKGIKLRIVIGQKPEQVEK